jgi:RNA polymerase sigma-70 factor (ECF subfamily)
MDISFPIRHGTSALVTSRRVATYVHEYRTEEELMAAYAAGDEQAFDALFDTLAPRLLAFFLRSMRDRGAAEDLLQATFTQLHASRGSYRRGAQLRPWLFTIAARVRADELRRRYRRDARHEEAQIEELPATTYDSDVPALDQRTREQAVRDALDRLPETQRVVLHLHRFENMSFGQIAQVLDLKEGAVRVRAFRAYETLRKLLLPLVRREEER